MNTTTRHVAVLGFAAVITSSEPIALQRPANGAVAQRDERDRGDLLGRTAFAVLVLATLVPVMRRAIKPPCGPGSIRG